MRMGSFIGIDFGTTNTAVVRLFYDEQGSRCDNLGEDGENPFSSVVAIPKNGGTLLFGRNIRSRREELAKEYEIFTSMKSYLGTDKEFIVGSNIYSATEITTEFFNYIKEHVARVHKTEIKEAGLSFPVDFSPEARRELHSAAENAGINVTRFVSEPTAAYFAAREKVKAYSRVMALDWGGGTFDISILDLKKNSVTEASVFGERIGGDDIDVELAKRVHAEIVKKTNSEALIPFDEMKSIDRDSMIDRCERAKIEISETGEDYDFHITNYGDYGTKSLSISVDLFNGIVEPIIKSKILKAIDTALGRAKLTPSGIDAVIIVGGSSNLAPYQEAIIGLFGEDKIIVPDKPAWLTAEGAAQMQLIEGNFKLNDSLGVLLSDGSVLPLFRAFQDGVGTHVGPLSFSLTEDAQDAHFIFTNSGGDIIFDRVNIPVKGFLDEIITVNAEIGADQIALIKISSPSMGNTLNSQPHQVEFNKLTFHYDMDQLN